MNRRGLACALWLVLLPVTGWAQDPKAAADAARADIKASLGFVPGFLSALPDVALPGAWEEMKNLQLNPNTALPAKIKELIGLGVAAQVPCKYCAYAHTELAKLNGASETEIKEAVVMAALTRHWSAFIQGTDTNLIKFRAEVAQWVEHAKQAGAAPPKPINVTDAASAMREAQQSFGSVPDFIKKFPAEGLAGAWKEERDVEMSPSTAISGKYKSLISLGVASQIPCRYCIVSDTAFARLQGASEREINEAVAMAAITRHWSTWLNGMQTDEKAFDRDVDRLVRNAKKAAAATAVAVKKQQAQAAKAAAAAAKAVSAKPAAVATAAPKATKVAAAPKATPAVSAVKPAAALAAGAKPAAAVAPPARPTTAAAPAPKK